MEGGLVRATTISDSVIFCTGSSFEYEFLRIVRRKHSCMITRVLFFLKTKEFRKVEREFRKEEVFRKKEICKGQGCKTKGCKTKKKRDLRMGEAGSDP